ncbi:glycosyltransferase [Dactylosporangium aurantiacum]|uniref:4,4'-diaponeurosporenoate glycosyltransferase n=1 Tax=Dactylosporangium aurantiacum TaxID=35754 RepID=A0A9Q9IJE7_9ACTN|nr:glycosyltransferase [Dactylosporangium aurantiacum]MDG6106046.1 glycosyltransferase [Dactylosporangium aurantiacum]UWZ55908.1 glycosyltransferase [Dactylosporangium aurantiacum]
MISVVIAAHNEAAVIGRCLDGIIAPDIDVTVVANGCSDDTAAIAAARPGVRVIDRPEPGKSGALNAGDAVAAGFPRVYLDADIPLTAADLRTLAAFLEGTPGLLAATTRRALDTRGRPLLVKAHSAINGRLPAYRDALYGRGVIALSAAGRARFDTFPEIVADDLFLDGLFAPGEKAETPAVVSLVETPRRTSDLVRRLARVRAGNAALRAAGAARPAARSSWLRDVVLPRPWLLPAAVGYVALTAAASRAARRSDVGWGHDTSTRGAVGAQQ